MRRPGDGSVRGFTLLETLVALALTALILAALAGAVERTARGHTAATDTAGRSALVRGVLLRIAGELEAADPGQRLVLEPDGALRFGTFERADGEPLAVAYDVDPATATLTRRQAPGRGRLDERTGLVLLEGVRRLRVRALDADGWHGQWQLDTLPRAVEFALRAGDLDVTLRIPLPASR